MPGTLCCFGTYDPDAARLRQLMAGWEAIGGTIAQLHAPLWPGSRFSLAPTPALAARWARAQAALWRGRERLAAAEAVLVPYPGHFDMPLAAWLARQAGKPLVFDPFLSLYDTAVSDRGRYAPGSWQARALAAIDRRALRLADVVLAESTAQADWLAAFAGISRDRVAVVPLGADAALFSPHEMPHSGGCSVLFYGTMIPLHGIETLLRAAKLLEDVPGLRVRLVGEGQVPVQKLIRASGANVEHLPAVPYERLPELIAEADVCLGIFGSSDKARRVVPHKVVEAAAMGKAIVTADTPATAEAFGAAVAAVPAGDAVALAGAIRELCASPEVRSALGKAARARFVATRGADAIGRALASAVAAAFVVKQTSNPD